jgi:hypothetical protein
MMDQQQNPHKFFIYTLLPCENKPLVEYFDLKKSIACAQTFADTALASACAVGGSILVMLFLRCLHPPGAAAALAPIPGGDQIGSLGYSFVLMPLGQNVAIMLVLAIAINRWVRYEYPIVPIRLITKRINTVISFNLPSIPAFQSRIWNKHWKIWICL